MRELRFDIHDSVFGPKPLGPGVWETCRLQVNRSVWDGPRGWRSWQDGEAGATLVMHAEVTRALHG